MGERFAGRVAIVTGGVSGIGAGIAARLAADGARVSVWDHDAAALAKAAAAHTVSVDVADAEAVQRAAEDTAAALGKIDILIACAGITGPVAPVWEYQVAAWDSVIDVNLNGVFYCNRAAVPHMLRNNYGRIVNIASIAGKEGNPNAAAYSASKAGVIGLTKSLGKELANTNVRVNCVTPAAVRTPLFAAAMDRCAPTSEVHLTRSTGNKWRRYDRLRTPPTGLVSIGDSICAFNPFYAQGISSASGTALLLREHLARAERLDAGFYAQFITAQRKLLGVPWRLAMARDQGYECAVGTEKLPEWQRRVVAAMSGPAFSLIVGAAREDAVVDEHFAKVFNMDESLGDMMSNPRVIAGLVRYRIRALLGRHRVPFGFDPQAEPPATDYSSVSAAVR